MNHDQTSPTNESFDRFRDMLGKIVNVPKDVVNARVKNSNAEIVVRPPFNSTLALNTTKNRTMKSAFVAVVILIGLLTGCSTVNPASIQVNSKLRSMKSAYVYTHGGSSADMDAHVQEALLNRGLKVRSGPESEKPADVDFYVRYADSWKWDITMYLKELHIQFYDAKDGTLLASGSFSNSFLHSFPDSGQKVSEVIATMYGEN